MIYHAANMQTSKGVLTDQLRDLTRKTFPPPLGILPKKSSETPGILNPWTCKVLCGGLTQYSLCCGDIKAVPASLA